MKAPLLLAFAAISFTAPTTYLLVTGILPDGGVRFARVLGDNLEVATWILAAGALVTALAIANLPQSLGPSARLAATLALALFASVCSCALALSTTSSVPLLMIGAAAMAVTVTGVFRHRECLRTSETGSFEVPYTRVLIVVGVLRLVSAALRAGAIVRFAGDPPIAQVLAYMVYLDVLYGSAQLLVALLRRRGSPYATAGTAFVSVWGFFMPFLPVLSGIYWLFVVRRRERLARGQFP